MTIFVNILRDSKHPKAREDLQSLNMAATFFATLIPGDGTCNYARFMAEMCANFERIARMVVEKDDNKPVKGRGEYSTNRPGSRRKGSTSTSHRRQTAPRKASSTTDTGIRIPNLEGLPPINSSGYVVPGSSSPSTSGSRHPSNTNTDSLAPDHPTRTMNNTPYNPNISDLLFPSTSTSAPSNTQNNIPTWPNFWQIPLTADWEFGGSFLNGLFPAQAQQGPDSFPAPPPPPPSSTTAAAPGQDLEYAYFFPGSDAQRDSGVAGDNSAAAAAARNDGVLNWGFSHWFE